MKKIIASRQGQVHEREWGVDCLKKIAKKIDVLEKEHPKEPIVKYLKDSITSILDESLKKGDGNPIDSGLVEIQKLLDQFYVFTTFKVVPGELHYVGPFKEGMDGHAMSASKEFFKSKIYRGVQEELCCYNRVMIPEKWARITRKMALLAKRHNLLDRKQPLTKSSLREVGEVLKELEQLVFYDTDKPSLNRDALYMDVWEQVIKKLFFSKKGVSGMAETSRLRVSRQFEVYTITIPSTEERKGRKEYDFYIKKGEQVVSKIASDNFKTCVLYTRSQLKQYQLGGGLLRHALDYYNAFDLPEKAEKWTKLNAVNELYWMMFSGRDWDGEEIVPHGGGLADYFEGEFKEVDSAESRDSETDWAKYEHYDWESKGSNGDKQVRADDAEKLSRSESGRLYSDMPDWSKKESYLITGSHRVGVGKNELELFENESTGDSSNQSKKALNPFFY